MANINIKLRPLQIPGFVRMENPDNTSGKEMPPIAIHKLDDATIMRLVEEFRIGLTEQVKSRRKVDQEGPTALI